MQKTVKFYKPNGLSRDITFVLRKRWEFVNDYKDSDPAEYKSDIEVFPGYYALPTIRLRKFPAIPLVKSMSI